MTGIKLSPIGERTVRRGGDDLATDDDMILLEIVKRAPGLSQDELRACFIAILTEYGPDALRAIRTGHVQFEERPAGERTVEHKEGTDE